MGVLFDAFKSLQNDYVIRYVPTGNGVFHYEVVYEDGRVISADTYEELMREIEADEK